MRNIFSGAVFIIFFFCSCNLFDSDSNVHLSHRFNSLSEYHLSDFKLSDDYSYLEIRRNDYDKQQTLYSFDESIADTLTVTQLKNIKEAISNGGFTAGCLPGSCPIYGVALLDHSDSVILLSSDDKLLKFFGNINSEAEIHFWLWAHEKEAISYEPVDNGYRAVIKWDNFCGKRGRDLVYVSRNGKITRIKRLSTEEYQGCV